MNSPAVSSIPSPMQIQLNSFVRCFNRTPKLTRRLLALAAVVNMFLAAPAQAQSDKIRIVTDIAPIHSLVSMVTGDLAQIELLVPTNQSPHSFSLKPSQLRAISQADVLIILSKEFTPTLARHIQSLKPEALVQLDGDHDETGTSLEKSTEHDDSNEHAEHDHLEDNHTWLGLGNAIAWLDTIESNVSRLDVNNQDAYRRNATKSRTQLQELNTQLHAQLSPVRSANYIVYHDAYQHFAKHFGLQKPTPIALSDARAPGAKKIRTIRASVKQSSCIFSEALHDDAIVNMVAEGMDIKRGILDPIGSTIPIGAEHYIELMSTMAAEFRRCLESSE